VRNIARNLCAARRKFDIIKYGSRYEKDDNACVISGLAACASLSYKNVQGIDVGTYRGIIPCADCRGISVKLVLKDDLSYVSKSKYLDKKYAYTEKGSWSVAGNILTLINKSGAQDYWAVKPQRLEKLDTSKKPIKSSFNYTIVRIE
jgi:uncharacterized lipoprotein NlpE involved in copper resistance